MSRARLTLRFLAENRVILRQTDEKSAKLPIRMLTIRLVR